MSQDWAGKEGLWDLLTIPPDVAAEIGGVIVAETGK